jgi:undecaprenyl-diphosphatase
MNTFIIFCGTYLIWAIALVGFIYLIQSHKRKRIALFAVVVLPVTYILGKIIGAFWYDPLPFVENGTTPLIAHVANNGFPSDHMLLAGAIASVVFAYNRPLGIILWILAVVVGVARVLAGVHHPIDVIAAAIIAVAVAWISWRVLRHWVA